jgi:hypothetical protein
LAREPARRIERKYRKKKLGGHYFEWEMINGKLSALNWFSGMNATCSTPDLQSRIRRSGRLRPCDRATEIAHHVEKVRTGASLCRGDPDRLDCRDWSHDDRPALRSDYVGPEQLRRGIVLV